MVAERKPVGKRRRRAAIPAPLTAPFRSVRWRDSLALGAVALLIGIGSTVATLAQDATWTGASFSDWNTPTNWSTGSVPTGTATFNGTTPTTIFLNSGQASIDTIALPSGAASYTFFVGVPGAGRLEFNGSGILNASASVPTLGLGGGEIDFNNGSSAGNATIEIAFSFPTHNVLRFNGSSTAGTADITNTDQLVFSGFSTAGNATIATIGFATTSFQQRATAGNAALTNSTTLIFTDSSSAESAQITNTGALNFQGGSTADHATITNSGGSTSFSGTSTAGSSHIINAASLNFGDASTAGNAHITDSAVLNFNGASTAGASTIDVVTLAGSVVFNDTSSAGSATINNAWFVTFNGASTAATAGIINSGNSVLGFNGTSSAGSAVITNNAALSLVQFSNSASAGRSTIVNFGILSFFNTSSAGQASIINSNALNFRDSSSAGNAGILNSKQIIFRDTSTAGNAVITNTGSGSSLTFLDTSTGGAARLINQTGGLVDFSASAGVNNDGRLSVGSIEGTGVFYLGARQVTVGVNNLSTTVSGLIADCSGTIPICQSGAVGGMLVKAGTGTLTLTGANTYSGGTMVSDGTLLISGAGTLGASSGTTNVAGGTLDLGGTTQTQALVQLSGGTIRNGGLNAPVESIGGIIDGLGGGASLTTSGGLTTLLGANSYTGATNVNGGILDVEGSITGTSLVSVTSGGVLTGAGIIDPLTVTIGTGGAFAPGNGTPGTSTTIIGNLALASGARYQVQIGSSTASFANVSGTATLGGATLNAVFTPGSFVTRQYTILTAGNVSGTFGTVTSVNMPANFKTNVSYGSSHAYLDLSLDFTPPPNSGSNGNQQNVGNAISASFNSGSSMPLAFGGLTASGLAQVSGEIATGSQQATFNAMDLFMGLLTDPFVAGRGDPASAGGGARDAFAAIYRKALPPTPNFEQRWSVWAAGYGGSQTTAGNAALGSNDASRSIYGTVVGADYRFSPDLLAGFALAGGGTGFGVNALGGGRSDLFQAGGFLRRTIGPAYLSGALAYGWQDITTDRTVTVAGIDRLRAEFDANAWSGRLEGGYRFAVLGGGLTPYAAGQFITLDLPAYAESALSGTGIFALDYAGKSVTDTRSELGLRADKSFALQDGLLTLRGRLAWAHDFDPGRSIAASFQVLPGASFVVNGASQAADSALATASAEIKWLNGWSASATFEGEFSNITRAYAGKGVLRRAW
jgi:autotransporter-associated beta strand protein